MSKFVNNVLKLLSGSAIAQLLGILLVPVVTRLYLPDDYGIYQLFISITTILGTVACLSYHMALMLPKEDDDSANVLALCLMFTPVVAVIGSLPFILFAEEIAELLNAPDLADYMFLIPVMVFLLGANTALNYWQTRRTRFGTLSVSRVVNSVSSKGVQIGVGASSATPFGLISGNVFGNLFSNIVLLHSLGKDKRPMGNISWKRMRELAVRYKKFPLITSWSSVSNAISLQVPSLMLSYFFTTTVVGYYSVANQVINIPIAFIGAAVGQVFFQKASEHMNRTGSVREIVSEVHGRLISIGVFPFLVLMVTGQEIFSFVLGVEWSEAGLYAMILAPWIFLVFVSSPMASIFSVLERQGVGLSFNILLLGSRFGTLLIGGMFFDPLMTLVLFSATGFIFWFWMNSYILRISGTRIKEELRSFFKYVLVGAGLILPVAISRTISPTIVHIMIVVAVTFVYYAFVLLNDDRLLAELRSLLRIGGAS
jgi:lipopolysaccharide exporter